MRSFSKEAMERPYRTIQAVELLREKADMIAHRTVDAREDEIVVAIVQKDLTFGGVWTLAQNDLARQILLLEDEGGWSLIFSPNSSVAQIEQRCMKVAHLARQRHEAMQRWMNRQSGM